MGYDVHLEIFEGPLDLLLYLIKKEDLDISEIEVSKITKEYLAYLDLLKEMNLEVAGDFLVMAATLMQIKAKMLLPKSEGEEEDGPNPLEELKSKLTEYQKFKEAAQLLHQREMDFASIYYRKSPTFDKDDYIVEVSIFDLMESFRDVLKELPKDVKEIVFKEIPIEQKIREILDMFEGKDYLSFTEILKKETTRHGLVVCFLSILELIRLKQIIARQSEQFGDFRVYRVKDSETADPGRISAPDTEPLQNEETVKPTGTQLPEPEQENIDGAAQNTNSDESNTNIEQAEEDGQPKA